MCIVDLSVVTAILVMNCEVIMFTRRELSPVYDRLTALHGTVIKAVALMGKRKATMHDTKTTLYKCVREELRTLGMDISSGCTNADVTTIHQLLVNFRTTIILCSTKNHVTEACDALIKSMDSPLNQLLLLITDDTTVQGSDNAALAGSTDAPTAYNTLRKDAEYWSSKCGCSKSSVVAKVVVWSNLAYNPAEIADAKIKVLAELANA